MVPPWNVGHSTCSKPDADIDAFGRFGATERNSTEIVALFALRHFIWQ